MKLTQLLLCASFTASLTAFAGEPQHNHGALSPEQVGSVHFTTSCNPGVESQFNNAVAMLHSFWYPEAEKTFNEVAVKDPNCAMAEWGIAMSRYHQLWEPPAAGDIERAQSALARAQSLSGKATPRECEYIAAIAGYFDQGVGKQAPRARAQTYSHAMQLVYEHNPGDREAAVFYALSLLALIEPTDKTYAAQKRAGVILNQVLGEQPNHPGVTHYLIHNFDYPGLAPMALNAARNYARIAPMVPHAQHMPSHIFTRLGLWEESIASNIAAESSAREYATKVHMDGAWEQQLHPMDYLIYAYLQRGDTQHARQVLEEAKAVVKPSADTLTASYHLAAIPARFAVERGDWAAAAHLPVRPTRFAAAEAITRTARGLGSARNGDVAAGAVELARLDELRAHLAAAGDSYWATQVEIQRREVDAWMAYASGKREEALNRMRSAVELEKTTDKINLTPGVLMPAQELLGDMLLAETQPRLALAAYEASLALAPNRLYPIQHAAQAAEMAGDSAKAAEYLKQISALTPSACLARPQL